MNVTTLSDRNQFPDHQVLESVLAKTFAVYCDFLKEAESLHLKSEWKFYQDGSRWLCRISLKDKTLCWLSAWPGLFKTGFYFSAKTKDGVSGLDIDKKIIARFVKVPPIGKLFPLTLNITKQKQLKDLLSLIHYKMTLV